MRLKLTKNEPGKNQVFRLTENSVKTLLILEGVFQDLTLPKTLNMVLGESCYNGLVRRKYNLLTPISKYTSPLAILAKGLALGTDLRLLFGVLDSVSKIPSILHTGELTVVVCTYRTHKYVCNHAACAVQCRYPFWVLHCTIRIIVRVRCAPDKCP